jgi:hypothetical protein
MSNIDFMTQGVGGNFSAIVAEFDSRIKGIRKAWIDSSAAPRKTNLKVQKVYNKYKKAMDNENSMKDKH